ncbi:nuclear-interacting partner of alk [Phtheirospermum japonicum]|uniref:Nuclear-interacting partner of alk n=1 Tax=Phtheirospermum japonicum TaxID=374723 RepID=A0A830CQW9_9LAMI|nr:nuclear-interacting partner of alk [Phtheirospermum japonicum]
MVEESEKRFEAIMNKLFHSPPKSKPNSTNIRHGVETLIGLKRPRSLVGNVPGESGSSLSCLCRPWDRDDLFRRLSTFKSITWFAKPQVVSPLECARRGWVNVDMDTIVCASCDARLLFSTPSAWTQQQVEKAAMVFSLKLESGHKLLCPWTNNVCTEELAQFPIVSRAGLIENYKKRCFALSNLIALPVILPGATDNMGSSQLEQFLRESSTSEYQELLESSRTKLPGHVPETVPSNLYYQCSESPRTGLSQEALKLISLFGWEPHILPYKVDLKDGQNQSIRDANVTVTAGRNPKVNVYCLCTREGTSTCSELQLDPSSVVLDCNLCGASVGLWAFCTTSQPLEYLRFVGVTEVTGKNVTTLDEVSAQEGFSGYQISTGNKESITNTVTTSLGFTIAGGPPPAMLNYGAAISLPAIGPNLRARLSIEKEAKDHLAIQKLSQVEGQQMSLESENATAEGTSATTGSDFIARNPLEVPQSVAGGSEHSREEMVEAENRQQGSSYPNNCLDNPGVAPFAKHKPDDIAYLIITGENKKLPSFFKSREFDPIKQHRHFCPWIMSTGKFAPGWQQTLSALVILKELDNVPLSTLIEVDDPVASVNKLFTTKN